MTVNDVLLWLVPLPILVGVGVAPLTSIATVHGAGSGAVIAAALIAYGLFVNAPAPSVADTAVQRINRDAIYPKYPAARLETRRRVRKRGPRFPATRLEALTRAT